MHTLTEQAAAVASGDVSPVELVQRALETVGQVEAEVNAFTHVLVDDALERARALEGAEPAGPLHGVPVAVKDLFDVRDLPTTGCCAAYADRKAVRDAAVVEALREAGAILVAKTNQHELAFGADTQVSSFGPVRNPWDHSRIPGGSSGGSGAAVAARAVAMALGSDTAGSIRIPAAMCGVTGLKPTHGAVSLRGAMPLAPSFDTAGPLALNAADCLLVHKAITGFDPDDLVSAQGTPAFPPEDMRRVRMTSCWLDEPMDPAVRSALEAAASAFESLGVAMDSVPGPDIAEAWTTGAPQFLAQPAYHFADLIDDERVRKPTRIALEAGRKLSATDVVAAIGWGRRLKRDFEWTLTPSDALLAPVVPRPAPLAGSPDELNPDAVDLARFTYPVNVAGLPAIAFPIGFTEDGLPLSAQLIGRPWSEEVLCALVEAYQYQTNWHTKSPGT